MHMLLKQKSPSFPRNLVLDFQCGFRPFRSTADPLTVVSNRIARSLNRFGATWVVALNISKAFVRVWHTCLLHKLRSYGISGQILDLIFSFLNIRRLWVVLDGKSSQQFPVNAGVPQASILVLNFSYDTLMTFLMMLYVILLPLLMITLYSKCDQASELWQQLELAS